MKKTRGASRRMRRVCTMWALSARAGRVRSAPHASARSGLTDEDEAGAEDADQTRVATLAHDAVHDGRDRAAEERGQHAQADVRHLVLDVAVPDVLKLKVAVVPDDPAGESEQQLCSVCVSGRQLGDSRAPR